MVRGVCTGGEDSGGDGPADKVVYEEDGGGTDGGWSADRIVGLKCAAREDGRKSHIFLDYSNKCQCGDVDLNTYRGMVLR
jgi:hypothetical protein